MSKKPTTIKDIAQTAQVSIATVSLALKDDPRITEATKQKIREIAANLKYIPNANAQSLKGIERKTIGVVVSNLTNPFFGDMVHGIYYTATNLGLNVALLLSNNDLQQEKLALDALVSMNVAGIILSGILYSKEDAEIEMVKRVQSYGIPLICADRYLNSDQLSYVSIDQYSAAYNLTSRLIDSGHRNIAVVSYQQSCHIIDERERGFCASMTDHLVPFSPNDIFYAPKDNNSPIDNVIDEILNSEKVYSVIFFICGDYFAIKAMTALKHLGYTIPDTISVVGFDDIFVSSIISPSLTTIRQPAESIGSEAVELLMKKINGDRSIDRIEIPYSIQWRESCCSDQLQKDF